MQLQLEQATQDAQHAQQLREAVTLGARQELERNKYEIREKDRRHHIWSCTHTFTMLRLNNPEAKMPYYVIRCKRSAMAGAINKVKAKHPHSIMIYQNTYVANPINLHGRLKKCGILKFSRNYCASYARECELIAKVGELCKIII